MHLVFALITASYVGTQIITEVYKGVFKVVSSDNLNFYRHLNIKDQKNLKNLQFHSYVPVCGLVFFVNTNPIGLCTPCKQTEMQLARCI